MIVFCNGDVHGAELFNNIISSVIATAPLPLSLSALHDLILSYFYDKAETVIGTRYNVIAKL